MFATLKTRTPIRRTFASDSYRARYEFTDGAVWPWVRESESGEDIPDLGMTKEQVAALHGRTAQEMGG